MSGDQGTLKVEFDLLTSTEKTLTGLHSEFSLPVEDASLYPEVPDFGATAYHVVAAAEVACVGVGVATTAGARTTARGRAGPNISPAQVRRDNHRRPQAGTARIHPQHAVRWQRDVQSEL